MNTEIEKVNSFVSSGASTTTKPKTVKSASRSGGKTIKDEPDKSSYIDPISVKIWAKNLGILYYGCELSDDMQQACLDGINMTKEQIICNTKVDEVVLMRSNKLLMRMDIRYKKLIDSLATFLETQAGYNVTTTTNLGKFFMKIAKNCEDNRKIQKVS